MKQRRFVLGDIHGEYDYLLEVLRKSKFNYEEDLLIQIGDIVDRGPEPFKCMDELLKIKNLVLILGNHDECFREYTRGKRNLLAAFPSNGVGITEEKWTKLTYDQRKLYKEKIFEKMEAYHLTDDNILFVHGGIDPTEPVEKQHPSSLTWDRELVNMAYRAYLTNEGGFFTNYKHIYIGHTPTLYYDLLVPFTGREVTNLDTGSGKGGPLTIMNIDTTEFWQSDYSEEIKKYVILKKEENTGVQEKQETTPQRKTARTTSRKSPIKKAEKSSKKKRKRTS